MSLRLQHVWRFQSSALTAAALTLRKARFILGGVLAFRGMLHCGQCLAPNLVCEPFVPKWRTIVLHVFRNTVGESNITQFN